MDPASLPREVRIRSAQHDARVLGSSPATEPQKISAVLGEQGSLLRSGELEDFLVGDPPVGLSRVQRSKDIVT
jgi:hypothetical protein